MHVLLSGGGTAGHVYPALAVVEALKEAQAQGRIEGELKLTWIGSASGPEADLARRSSIAFRALSLRGGLRGRGLGARVLALVGLLVALLQAIRLVRLLHPSVILVTGGYASVPAVLAGWLWRIPSLMYLPDITPGWAVRFLAPFARRIAVTAVESKRYFKPSKVVVSGYPVRKAIFGQDRKTAREAFGLDPDVPTILVVGGSRGAHSLNVAVAGMMPHLLTTHQVVHVTGQQEAGAMREVRDHLPAELKKRYRPYGFLHEDMAKALAAADVVVCRAGASVLGEIPAAGVAAILVPYTAGHKDQVQNAAALTEKGAAVTLDDSAMTPNLLEETIRQVFEPQRLTAMRQAAAALACPQAANVIAEEIIAISRR